jgi:hypothetical protein
LELVAAHLDLKGTARRASTRQGIWFFIPF